jgi:hypothetical protein
MTVKKREELEEEERKMKIFLTIKWALLKQKRIEYEG